jgi:hypothetical protein
MKMLYSWLISFLSETKIVQRKCNVTWLIAKTEYSKSLERKKTLITLYKLVRLKYANFRIYLCKSSVVGTL